MTAQKEEKMTVVLAEMEAQGESIEEYDHDDPRFADQGEESEGEEGILP